MSAPKKRFNRNEGNFLRKGDNSLILTILSRRFLCLHHTAPPGTAAALEHDACSARQTDVVGFVTNVTHPSSMHVCRGQENSAKNSESCEDELGGRRVEKDARVVVQCNGRGGEI
jgi:hypothetical protein